MLLCVNIADEQLLQPQGRALWEEVLDALDAITPLIEDVRPGLAFLDMHGIDDDAEAWMERTRTAVRNFELPLRIGVGAHKIAARAAAYVADGSVCRYGQERDLLAPLPLELLEIDPATIERLHLLGVERLGDLAGLPHGPFVRRFGSDAEKWHDLACGIDRTPFVPRPHAVAIEAATFGEGRAEEEAQVLFALRVLVARVCADLERCGKSTGLLCLEIELEDAQASRFDVVIATPTSHERTLFDMLRAKLDGMTFSAAIVGLRVQATHLEEGGELQALFTADDVDPQRVAVAIARLNAAIGEDASRAITHRSHVLEERFSYEPFKLQARQMFAEARAEAESDLVPQLRLLEVREIAVQLHSGEPAVVDRRVVLECIGPWRIAERVHTTSMPVTRDEYDVVLEDGAFARIYHQGSHWYLRGVYQ